MDENTWRLSQLIMWAIGIQTTLILAAFSSMWFVISKRFDDVDKRFDQIDKRIDRLDEKIMDIDRRLCRIEGSMAAKECCILKDERKLRKAE